MTGFTAGYQYPVGTTIEPGSIAPGDLAPAPFDPAILLYTGGAWGYASPGGGGSMMLSYLVWTRDARVPGGGQLYLSTGDRTIASAVGQILPSGVTIKGLTLAVNNADATNDYELQVITDPTGAQTPVVGATLALASTNRTADRRDLSIALAKVEYGLRLVRTAGAGNSDFNRIVAVMEVELP